MVGLKRRMTKSISVHAWANMFYLSSFRVVFLGYKAFVCANGGLLDPLRGMYDP